MNTENAINAEVSAISAIGRLLVALIFIRGGIDKLGSIVATGRLPPEACRRFRSWQLTFAAEARVRANWRFADRGRISRTSW
jgi:uncharacterized membrane protein YphA (DoxX/SURF4 family)